MVGPAATSGPSQSRPFTQATQKAPSPSRAPANEPIDQFLGTGKVWSNRAGFLVHSRRPAPAHRQVHRVPQKIYLQSRDTPSALIDVNSKNDPNDEANYYI